MNWKRIFTAIVVVCILVLIVSFWQYRVIIALLIVVPLVAFGLFHLYLYTMDKFLPVQEKKADIQHKRMLTQKEASSIDLRKEAMQHARYNTMQVELPDMRVTHSPHAKEQALKLPPVRVTEELTLPPIQIQKTKDLPKLAPLRRPTIDELTQAVAPNSFEFSLGRSLTTNELIIADLNDKHLKVIGGTRMGKSSLLAAILEQLRRTHDSDYLQFAILDLENTTGRLFERDEHILLIDTKQGKRRLHARDPKQVAYALIFLHAIMLQRYEDANAYGWAYIDQLPHIIVYFEEFLYWKRTLSQFVQDPQERSRTLAAFNGIATRGLKVGMHLAVSAQVDYADKELAEAMAQFIGVNVSFTVKPTAARAAGFTATNLLNKNFEAKLPGQCVIETTVCTDIAMAPDFDVRAKVKELAPSYSSMATVIDTRATRQVETLPSVVRQQTSEVRASEQQTVSSQSQGALYGNLLEVYTAMLELNTRNNRTIAKEIGISDSMAYRLIQQLREMGYELPKQ